MMKKIGIFLLSSFFYFWLALPVLAADPHLEFAPATGIVSSSGTSIEVKIDTGGQAAKSAKAVVKFDPTLLEVSSVQAGTFFDDVSHNIYNSTGQVVINANLSVSSMVETKTGTGTLATMTVKAKASSGTATLTFDCTQGSSTDSNINDPTPVDIIICTSNGSGSYTLSGSTAPSGSPGVSGSPSPGSSPGASGGTSGGTGGTGGTSGTNPPIPVTATSWPTIVFLVVGLGFICTPFLTKLFVK